CGVQHIPISVLHGSVLHVFLHFSPVGIQDFLILAHQAVPVFLSIFEAIHVKHIAPLLHHLAPLVHVVHSFHPVIPVILPFVHQVCRIHGSGILTVGGILQEIRIHLPDFFSPVSLGVVPVLEVLVHLVHILLHVFGSVLCFLRCFGEKAFL